MSVNEPARHHLYEAARTGGWDDQAAATLMSLLPPVGWADVATKQDLAALGDSLRGEIAQLRGEMYAELGSIRGEMGALRGEMGDLRGSMATRSLVVSLAGILVASNGAAIAATQLLA